MSLRTFLKSHGYNPVHTPNFNGNIGNLGTINEINKLECSQSSTSREQWEQDNPLKTNNVPKFPMFPSKSAIKDTRKEAENSETDDGIKCAPEAYRDAYTSFLGCKPEDAPPELWERAKEDAEAFFSRWGEMAAHLGWDAYDLFERIPGCKYGHGLIWTLANEQAWVSLLTDTTAILERDEIGWRAYFPRMIREDRQ